MDPAEALFKPIMLQRFMAFKAAEYTPGPVKRLAAAALGRWWGDGAAATAEESEQGAELKELMGW
jgi:hypothetical protein